jgi:hypothetical protein
MFQYIQPALRALGASTIGGDGELVTGKRGRSMMDLGFKSAPAGSTPAERVAVGHFDANKYPGVSPFDFSKPLQQPAGESLYGGILPSSGNVAPQESLTAQAGHTPMDRVKAAFDALREQGYGSGNGGAPMSLAQHMSVTVPDKARPEAPAAAPADDGGIGFFMRNALAQRAEPGGDYLDPEMAAKAMASPFLGMF